MRKLENHPFISGLIASLIIISFGAIQHFNFHIPNDWGAFAFWIPIYLSPIGIVSTLSWWTEKKKREISDG